MTKPCPTRLGGCQVYTGNVLDYHCEQCNKHVVNGHGFRGEFCSQRCAQAYDVLDNIAYHQQRDEL